MVSGSISSALDSNGCWPRVRLVGAEALLGCGQPLEAAVHAEEALTHDPYDEHALRLLMRAHADAGRPASALARYAAARELLSNDLGVSPAAETEALHTAILLAGEQTDRPAPLRSFERADLYGRERELGTARHVARFGHRCRGARRRRSGHRQDRADRRVAEPLVRPPSRSTLLGRCDELGRDLSLQPVLDALAAYLRGMVPDDVRELLGAHLDLIGPLVGVGVSARSAPGHAREARQERRQKVREERNRPRCPTASPAAASCSRRCSM